MRRQLTVRAIILSLILTVLLAAANAYLGLFAGLTVATAIPAAVVSMGVLRMLGPLQHPRKQHRRDRRLRRLVDRGRHDLHDSGARASWVTGHDFEYWWVLAIAGLGGLLGVLFSVPLRRTLILDQKLQFPEGVATAEVLKIGEDPGRGLKALSLAPGRRAFQARAVGPQVLTGILHRRALFRRAHDRFLRHQPVARTARSRLISSASTSAC